jgi:protein TonB
MKKLLLSFILLSLVVCAKAQTTNPPDVPDLDKLEVKDTTRVDKTPGHVFTSIEMAPRYPGGTTAFFRYIGLNLRYPKNNLKNKIEGKVTIAFVVDTDGSLTQIKVLNGVSPDIDAEAIRLIKNSPKWIPGIQNGRPVRVPYSVIIDFKLAAQNK